MVTKSTLVGQVVKESCLYCTTATQEVPITVAPPPSNTADLGTDKKAAVFGNRRYSESYYITYKTLIWDLEMGGGIGVEAVLGGAVLGGGDDCTINLHFLSH